MKSIKVIVMSRKVISFQEKIGVIPPVAAPSDTNPSVATETSVDFILSNARKPRIFCAVTVSCKVNGEDGSNYSTVVL